MPPRAIKHQLTCSFEITSGSFVTGRIRILVIPRSHLVGLKSHEILEGDQHKPLVSDVGNKTLGNRRVNYLFHSWAGSGMMRPSPGAGNITSLFSTIKKAGLFM